MPDNVLPAPADPVVEVWSGYQDEEANERLTQGWVLLSAGVDENGYPVYVLGRPRSVTMPTRQEAIDITAGRSTWPENCPTCGAPWRSKSRTMGAAFGQPHRGTCENGHQWNEGGHLSGI